MTSPNQDPNADVTPEPVWDGEGQDPWLPDRLQAALDAAHAEQLIYATVWEQLSTWLIETSRRVLSGPVPQPEAIFAQAPAWERAVDAIILNAIIPVMSWAYEGLMGKDFAWNERPNVLQYLAGVRNRMSNTPDETFNLVSAQIGAGVMLGEGIPELSNRVEEVLSTTGSARWKNRAVTISRTEVMGALNGSRTDAFQAFAEESDEDLERVWVSSLDARTRHSHRDADGERASLTEAFMVGETSLLFPGDPSGPPGEVINCIPADALVDFPSIRAVTRRWFEGEMVRLHFASGDVLSITPNHPILRSDGIWTPAALLKEGDYCISGSFSRDFPGEPDKYGGPSHIGEIYSSASQTQSADRVALSPPDFHGDFSYGEVEVVPIDGDLRFYGEPSSEQEILEFGFSLANLAASASCCGDHSFVPFRVSGREIDGFTSPGSVCCGGELASLGVGVFGQSDDVGFGGCSGSESKFLDSGSDRGACYSQGSGDCQNALPSLIPDSNIVDINIFPLGQTIGVPRTADSNAAFGKSPVNAVSRYPVVLGKSGSASSFRVAPTEIINIDRYAFSGHVFNLDTGVGWYIANGITLRNCRCTTLLVEKGESINIANRYRRR